MISPLHNTDTAYRDRSFGLVVFGVIEILIGGVLALMVPLSLLAWWVSGAQSSGLVSLRSILPMMVTYAIFAAVMIWLGIGTIRARRWARTLMLSLSRIWLVTGLFSLAITCFTLPGLVRIYGAGAGLPSGAVVVVMIIALVIAALIYVVLPGAFVFFFHSPHVIATCRASDPRRQFTDDCPPRILMLATLWVLMAVSVVIMPAYNWVFPFFGKLLSGTAGVVPWLVVFVGCCVLAVGSFRRRAWAWWGAVAATVAAAVSTVVTSIRVGPEETITALRLPDEQMHIMASFSWPGPWVISMFWIAVWASMLAYLFSVRRDFGEPPSNVND